MSLKIAVQMDAIESINIKSDTTFVLALEAQKRGHKLYYYQPKDLSLKNGEIFAKLQKISLRYVEDDYFTVLEAENVKLREFDVVLMRQDPPFDMNYLTYTYMLEKIADDVLVLNNPAEVRNCPEKLLVTDFKEFTPKTIISSDKEALREFLKEQGDIVLKPLYAFAGDDVFRVDEKNFDEVSDNLLKKYNVPVIGQEFLKEIYQGDKRIILIDGEAVGALNRIPKDGEIRSNLAAGGVGEKTTLSEREKQICQVVGEQMKKRGLLLAGIDVIGGYLTEINVTSPTGIQSINRFDNTCLESVFWDAVEGKLSAYK